MPNQAAPTEAELSRDRCPNCGRRLKFPESRAEGLCPSCGIYVEVLSPLSSDADSGPVEDVVRRKELAVMYLDLEEMEGLEDESEEPSESHRPEAPLEEPAVPPAPPAPEPPAPPADVVPASQRPRPSLTRERINDAKKSELLDLSAAYGLDASGTKAQLRERLLSFLDEEEAKARPSGPEDVPEPFDQAPSEFEASAPAVESEAVAPPVEAEAAPQPDDQMDLDELEFLPVLVPPERMVPAPPPEAEAVLETAKPIVEPAEVTEAAVEPDEAVAPKTPRRRDRVLFYVGGVHVVLGGVGLLLGSVLHDMFRVPFIGRAFEAFGPLNVSAALLGGVLLAAGIAAMTLGARGGVVRPERAAEG